VRAELARILAAAPFQHNPAESRALRLAVEEKLAGRSGKLKQAQAAKLRTGLLKYYSSQGLHDAVRIDLPEGRNVPVFFSVAAPIVSRPTAGPPAGPKKPRRLWLWVPPGLAAAILLGWAGSWWHARAASADIRSLAVLPFADMSPQKDGDWLGEGITQEVIDALASLPGLRVTARDSAFQSKDQPRDIARIGQQLGVAALIEGSIRKAGGRLRVDVHMDRASDGYHLWSGSFNRPAGDVLALQREIAAAIAGRVHIGSASLRAPRHQAPPQASDAYLEGRYFFNRADPVDLDKAAERLEESTRIDPEFSLAWAWLSIVREYRVDAGMARSNQAMPGSRDAAERAVALDPDSGEAHLALGIVKLQYDWDWAGAKQELDRAVQLNPESSFALHWRGHWFETQGRMEEAMADIQRSLALDPLSAVLLGDVGGLYLSLHQPKGAIPFAQKAVELYPDDITARGMLAGVLCPAGHFSVGGRVPPFVAACLSARQGDPAAARQLLDQAEDLPDEQLMPSMAYVQLAAAIGDWDRFFSWAQQASDERDVQLPYLRLIPDVPASDPRFVEVLTEMNLPAASQ
jgi:serine/threonine-protein kinase